MPGRSHGDGGSRPPGPGQRPWIHPSELPGGAHPPAREGRRSRLAVPITAGLAGALAALGAATLVWSGDSSGPGSASSVTRVGAGPTVLTTGDAGVPASVPVVRVAAWEGPSVRYGTAVVFRSDGLLVTAAAVVDEASVVEVAAPGGDVLTAELVGVDPENDLALLRLERSDLEAVSGTGGSLEPGDACILVGAGNAATGGPTVGRGVVAATGMVWQHDGGWLVDAIEVDGPRHESAIGGALLDGHGRLAGIITSATGSVARGALVVPAARVRRSMGELLAHGKVRYAWLGLATGDAPPPQRGALVHEVSPGGPSARAGVEVGDIVVSLAGEPIEGMASLIRAVRHHEPRDTLPLVVQRGGETVETTVVLGAKP